MIAVTDLANLLYSNDRAYALALELIRKTDSAYLVGNGTQQINLYVIISVGYRIKSTQGIKFRQWATQRLKDYLIPGYTLNEKRLEQQQQQLQTLKEGIRILSRVIESKSKSEDINWLSWYSTGLELLDDYDHEKLDATGLTKRQAIYPELKDYFRLIDSMRTDFGSGIFGKEKDQGFQSATLQIAQGFGNTDFYPSIEEKRLHFYI